MQLPRDVSGFAVLGQYDGFGRITRQLDFRTVTDLAELSSLRVPRLPGTLGSVENLAVRR